MKVINYGRQSITQDDIDAVVAVLRGDYLTQGPKVDEFEAAICAVTGAKHCVAVSNGTAGLHLAVAALDLPPDAEGITSPNTFLASPNAFVYSAQRPVFADIDPKTYNLTPETVERCLTGSSAAVMPVHFAGQPCDMQEIGQVAKAHGLRVIEDAAHAIGARYKDGGAVGNCAFSDMTVFSFHPVKTVTTGEGGAITTNSDDLYERLCMLRTHGVTKDPGRLQGPAQPWYYEMQALGFNYRMPDILAALGISQLTRLAAFVSRRREICARYNTAFSPKEWLTVPFEADGVYSAPHLYVVRIDFELIGRSRAEVMYALREQGVGTQVHYIPVYRQPYYVEHFPVEAARYEHTERYCAQCLSLPLYPAMTEDDVARVIAAVLGLAT